MKTFLISSFFTSLSITCFGQTKLDNKIIAGTWINNQFLNCLRTCDFVEKEANYIPPRFIYIDSALFYEYEHHFEQISRKTKLVYQRSTSHYVAYSQGFYHHLLLLNDSTLASVVQDTIRNTFTKISSYAVAGSGMQIYFRNLYLNNNRFWKLVHIDNDKADTQRVIINFSHILDRKKKYISQFEFGDTYQESLNGKMLFTLSLFDVDKTYRMVNDRLFKIKKVGNEINLYRKENLEYILIPDSEQ